MATTASASSLSKSEILNTIVSQKYSYRFGEPIHGLAGSIIPILRYSDTPRKYVVWPEVRTSWSVIAVDPDTVSLRQRTEMKIFVRQGTMFGRILDGRQTVQSMMLFPDREAKMALETFSPMPPIAGHDPSQCGAVLIEQGKITSLEFFDSSKSWICSCAHYAGSHAKNHDRDRENDKIVWDLVRGFIDETQRFMEFSECYKHVSRGEKPEKVRIAKVEAHDGVRGEVTEIDGEVIHFLLRTY